MWSRVEKYVRVSFWGLNLGLALMVLLNLFPGGIVQLRDVLENGYWHARSLDFILAGVVPVLRAAAMAWRFRNESAGATTSK